MSKRQRTVARLLMESEYRSVAHTTAEVRWISHLLDELGVTTIGATYICANPVFHSRMNHIALDYHFVHQLVQNGQLHVSHISMKDQLVNILTKPLSRLRFTLI